MSKTKRFRIDKLMRSGVPEWMKLKGIRYSISKGIPKNALYHLCLKLEEEANELRELCRINNISNLVDKVRDEMADVLEVMMSIAKKKGISWDDVESWRKRKSDERGDFEKYIYVNWVEMSEDNPEISRYEDNYKHPQMEEEQQELSNNKSEFDKNGKKSSSDQDLEEKGENSDLQAHPGQAKGGRVAQARRHGDPEYTEGHKRSSQRDPEEHPGQTKGGRIAQARKHGDLEYTEGDEESSEDQESNVE